MGGVLSVYRTVRQQDPHNQVPSILTLVLLAHFSRMDRFRFFQACECLRVLITDLPKFAFIPCLHLSNRHRANKPACTRSPCTYTDTQWNLVAFLFNYSFRLRWEAPLVCNSMAIMTCFNCAQVDARADLIIRSGVRTCMPDKCGPISNNYLSCLDTTTVVAIIFLAGRFRRSYYAGARADLVVRAPQTANQTAARPLGIARCVLVFNTREERCRCDRSVASGRVCHARSHKKRK